MKKLLFILAFLPLVGFSQTKMIVNYVKTDSIKARSNWVEVIDSTNYHKDLYVRDTSIVDLIVKYAAEDVVNIGSPNQIPFVNALGTDLDYSPNFTWNDTTLLISDNLENIFIGSLSGKSNSTGEQNSYLGGGSGYSSTDGCENIFIGYNAGYSNITGSNNVYLGNGAGFNSTGSSNVFVGYSAGSNETGSNKLYIENSSSANALIKGDFVTDELWLNTDTTHIAGHLEVDSNLYVSGRSILEKYEVAAYLDPDSTITTSVTTSFSFLGGGSNNKFSNIYAEGFSFDGDTLQFDQAAYDYRDSVEFNIDYSCATAAGLVNRTITYGIMIKSVGETTYTEYRPTSRKVRTKTAGIYYSGATCSTMPIFLRDGDKIWIVVKCATNTATVSTQDFGIYLREQQ